MSLAVLVGLVIVVQPPWPVLPSVHSVDRLDPRVSAAPGVALADLELSDRDAATAFSMGGPAAYPADSLAADRVTRARAWVARAVGPGARNVMHDPALRAELEAAAGHDETAERTFLDEVLSAPRGRRSYLLATAVATFSDGQRDDGALASALPFAERALTRLLALPQGGYTSAYDSVVLVDRAWTSVVAVVAASARLGDTARVARHTTQALTVLTRYTEGERVSEFMRGFPYAAVATVMLGERQGRAALDTLAIRLLRALAAPSVESELHGRMAEAAPLGASAPPVVAHAWLNTADSLYDPVARVHQFNDGVIRLLFFAREAWRQEYTAYPALTRLQDAIGTWGQVVIVTHTDGHKGTDLVEAPEEVAWLRQLYREEAHLTPVIAQWAAPKRPAPYDGRLPVPPPLDSAYVAIAYGGHQTYPAVIVDGRGIIRGFARLESRRDEDRLRRALLYLHAEAAGAIVTAVRPSLLVPPDARAH